MMTSATSYWASRDRTYGSGWCNHYWDATDQPHRRLLVEALRRMALWTSIAEIGCNVGTNLRLIASAFPHARVAGFDVNRVALAYGQDRLDGSFVCADVHHLPLRDESIDVIMSCYALAYVSPTDLPKVIDRLIRVCRIGLVIAEPMVGPEGEVSGGCPEWRHRYLAHLPGRRTTLTTVSPPVDHLNGIVTWEK